LGIREAILMADIQFVRALAKARQTKAKVAKFLTDGGQKDCLAHG
jgi:hypothetical protein